jgi:hypothetical protein
MKTIWVKGADEVEVEIHPTHPLYKKLLAELLLEREREAHPEVGLEVGDDTVSSSLFLEKETA